MWQLLTQDTINNAGSFNFSSEKRMLFFLFLPSVSDCGALDTLASLETPCTDSFLQPCIYFVFVCFMRHIQRTETGLDVYFKGFHSSHLLGAYYISQTRQTMTSETS